MHISMTLGSMLALFGAMLVLAFIPSISTMTVAIRSASCGFSHGFFTSLGIVAGDFVFIVIAIYGLSLLADLLGQQFELVRYVGGAYLLWLGVMLWRSKSRIDGSQVKTDSSFLSSFLAGLFITLADQKAILFYLGFFPAFIDLSELTFIDAGIIVVIAALAVGGPKLVYAILADRAGVLLINTGTFRAINGVAGLLLIGIGLFLIVRT